MNNIVRKKFMENFNMSMIVHDLINLMEDIGEEMALEKFINEKFDEKFSYGELYDLFKDEVDKKDLEVLLENMGQDFIDLDKLNKYEKEMYYKRNSRFIGDW